MLNTPKLGEVLHTMGFQPDIDLFASSQFPKYVAYRPDPQDEVL